MDFSILATIIGLFVFVAVALWPYGSCHESHCNKGKKEFPTHYTLGSRKIEALPGLWTILASKVGGGFLVSVSVIAAAYGWSAFFFFVGYLAGYAIFAVLASRLYERSKEKEFSTLADLFLKPDGTKSRPYFFIKALSIATMFGWVLTNLISGARMLDELTSISFMPCALLILTTVSFYIFIGGYPSVVRSDGIQIGALFLILVGAIFALSTANPSNEVDFSALLSSKDSLPTWRIILFLVLGLLFPLGSYDLYQRMYSASSRRAFVTSSIFSGVTFLLVGTLVIAVTILTVSQSDPKTLDTAEKIFTIGVGNLLGDYRPIWIIAGLAAILSSLDTFLFACASSLCLGANKLDASGVKKTRTAILYLAILAFLIVMFQRSVILITYIFAGLTMLIGITMLIKILFRHNKDGV